MSDFTVEEEPIALPRGAVAKARRLKVGWRGRAITALSQGEYRAYLYPVLTPAGVVVTAEAPIDHPHHQSVTVGTDHFNCYPPFSTDKYEEATYNFYINEPFQGRAPGRIVGVSADSTELSEDHLRIVQELEWQGPEEWGADGRRILARETRTYDIFPGEPANAIDVRSQLRPTDWRIQIGPTRHAYLTVRMADGLRAIDGATVVDSEGRTGVDEVDGQMADWVDCTGIAAYGQAAGLALVPGPSVAGLPWHVAAYGDNHTVNPFSEQGRKVGPGEEVDVAVRIVAHDGDAVEANVAELQQAFTEH